MCGISFVFSLFVLLSFWLFPGLRTRHPNNRIICNLARPAPPLPTTRGPHCHARHDQRVRTVADRLDRRDSALSALGVHGGTVFLNTFQPRRDPGSGWHRRRRRSGTANQY